MQQTFERLKKIIWWDYSEQSCLNNWCVKYFSVGMHPFLQDVRKKSGLKPSRHLSQSPQPQSDKKKTFLSSTTTSHHQGFQCNDSNPNASRLAA